MTKTKTKTKKRRAIADLPHVDCDKETGEPNAIEALVVLGSMSINEHKVSISFSCELEPEVARLVLAEGQLSVFIEPENEELFDAAISGIAECHRLSIGHGMDQKGRLSFQRDAVEIPALAKLACTTVRMMATRQGPAGKKKEEEE